MTATPPGHGRSPGPWRARAADVAVAAGVTGFLLLVAAHQPVRPGHRAFDPFGYALLVTAGASMAWCRRHPRAVLGVVVAVLGCYVARRYQNGPVLALGWISLLVLSRREGRRPGLAGAAALSAVLAVAGVVGADSPLPLVFLGWSAAAVFLGDALRNRRSYLAELEARARDLEQSREEEARRRVAEERLRIARDLHDSVAHAMATINVQAAAAAHVVDRRPEAAREALLAIRRASGDVLDELAAMLQLLRADGESAERAPTPDAGAIGQLVAATRDAGLRVELEMAGPVGELARPVSTAAYRVVQESLTNVLRHAGAATARVRVTADARHGLVVEVGDDGAAGGGPGPAGNGTGPGGSAGPGGSGTGLRGMRERVESTGGRLAAGPAPGGGFAVRASWDGRP